MKINPVYNEEEPTLHMGMMSLDGEVSDRFKIRESYDTVLGIRVPANLPFKIPMLSRPTALIDRKLAHAILTSIFICLTNHPSRRI